MAKAVEFSKNEALTEQKIASWHRLLTLFPELSRVNTREAWDAFVDTHPSINRADWDNKFLAEEYISSQPLEDIPVDESRSRILDPFRILHLGHAGHNSSPHQINPESMQDDTRYKNLLRKKVDDWRRINPEKKIPNEIYVKNPNGATIVNPEVLKLIPSIHQMTKTALHQMYTVPYSLDQDARYMLVLTEEIDAWKKTYGSSRLPKNIFLANLDGSEYLNPEVLKAFPALREVAQKKFAERYTKANEYYQKEKNTIYENSQDDPAIIALQKQIPLHRENEYASLATKETRLPRTQQKSHKELVAIAQESALKKLYGNFALDFEKKAKAYASSNTHLKDSLERTQSHEQAEEKQSGQVEPQPGAKETQPDIPLEKTVISENMQQSPTKETIAPIVITRPIIMSNPMTQKSTRTEPAREDFSIQGSRKRGIGNMFGKTIGKNILGQAERVGIRAGLAATSEIWATALLIILIGIIVLVTAVTVIILLTHPKNSIINQSSQTGTSTGTASSSIPGLTLTKTSSDPQCASPNQGDFCVSNGQDIHYSITVNYSGPLDVVVTDTIPSGDAEITDYSPQTTGATTDAPVTATKNTVSWHLKSFGSGPIYTFFLTVHPLKADFKLQNTSIATASDGGTGLGGSGPIDKSILQSGSFDSIFTGQGRNITILGDENNFVTTVISNGASFGLSGKNTQLHEIYQDAIALNVNPLAVLTIWGTETGFTGDAKAFSCPVGVSSSFSQQTKCAAQTLNNFMTKFEREKGPDGTLGIDKVDKAGNKIGGVCTYSDPFLYALEWYGPVCHSNDHNENWHADFLNKFKKLLGA